MSGIAGIVNLDGAPADVAQLERLAAALAFRGPDAADVWSKGPAGLVHTLLRTAGESGGERQPASLDGKVWITADARLDARNELVKKFEALGVSCRSTSADCELILRAYAAWGEECVRQLLGDFAFAIWDSRNGRLFCARDHFGIKPFYYARLSNALVFSNTLSAVRAHPDVSERLNESAIADFLLAGLNRDPATTVFADVQRLAPAHTLTCSAEGLRLKRYWTLPVDGAIRYPRGGEYVEHFNELFSQAVGDRLRMEPAGVFLSGGLDSSAVVATARRFQRNAGDESGLHAFTISFPQLPEDAEPRFARMVAAHLGIPIHELRSDHDLLFARWEQTLAGAPEPVDDPFLTSHLDHFRKLSAHCRVALSGEGSDNLMHFEMWPYAAQLYRRRQWLSLLMSLGSYARWRWRLPRPGLRGRLRQLSGAPEPSPPCPTWLRPDFAARVGLADRWRDAQNYPPGPVHPARPRASASMALPDWTHMFEQNDPGVTGCAVEVRYPFLDLRLVSYLLALPPVPWFVEKELLRRAMRGQLPEEVRRRPKQALAGDPLVEMLRDPRVRFLEHVSADPRLENYVNPAALPPLLGEEDSEAAALNVRPYALNFWLQSFSRMSIHSEGGTLCGRNLSTPRRSLISLPK
jgi:asparagine synthase (glutamine-hydrolysing)